MTTLTVSAEILLDDEQLDDRIVAAAAEKLLGQVNLAGRYGGKVAELINESLTRLVEERVNELMEKPVRPVDSFGDPTGEAQMFKHLFAKAASTFLEGMVNNDGSPAGSGSYNRQPRLAYLIEKAGLKYLESEMLKVAKQFKEQLDKRAAEALGKVINEQLTKSRT